MGRGRNMLVIVDDEEVALLGVGESREMSLSSDKKEIWVKMDWASSAKLAITHDGNVCYYICGEESFLSGFVGMLSSVIILIPFFILVSVTVS